MRSTRPGARFVLALLFLSLTALPILDAARVQDPRLHAEDPEGWWAFTPPYYPGDDYPTVTTTLSRTSNWNSHYLAITAAWAAADAAGGRVGEVLVPPSVSEMLDREGDPDFGGRPAQVTEGYLMWYTGGRYHEARYDPVLSASRVRELDADPDLRSYPWDVWALVDGSDHEVVRLYTDEARERLFLLPEEDS